MNSLPKTVTDQRRDCDLNPGPSAPESSTLATRLPSVGRYKKVQQDLPGFDELLGVLLDQVVCASAYI